MIEEGFNFPPSSNILFEKEHFYRGSRINIGLVISTQKKRASYEKLIEEIWSKMISKPEWRQVLGGGVICFNNSDYALRKIKNLPKEFLSKFPLIQKLIEELWEYDTIINGYEKLVREVWEQIASTPEGKKYLKKNFSTIGSSMKFRSIDFTIRFIECLPSKIRDIFPLIQELMDKYHECCENDDIKEDIYNRVNTLLELGYNSSIIYDLPDKAPLISVRVSSVG